MSKTAIVGQHTYGSIRNAGEHVSVGKYCSIAAGVSAIILNDHRVDWISTYPFPKRWRVECGERCAVRQNPKIIVENDVWIGQNAILLENTIIRNGAVIGSQAVVHSEIPPYCVAVGNPARVVRKRFSDEDIEALLRIQWWNWPDEKVA